MAPGIEHGNLIRSTLIGPLQGRASLLKLISNVTGVTTKYGRKYSNISEPTKKMETTK